MYFSQQAVAIRQVAFAVQIRHLSTPTASGSSQCHYLYTFHKKYNVLPQKAEIRGFEPPFECGEFSNGISPFSFLVVACFFFKSHLWSHKPATIGCQHRCASVWLAACCVVMATTLVSLGELGIALGCSSQRNGGESTQIERNYENYTSH